MTTILLSLLASPAARTLIVGGGPSRDYNQVAIESNVRYVTRILPPKSPLRILFADGDPTAKTVLYTDKDGDDQFREPQLSRLDGAAIHTNVRQELVALAKEPSASTLLYFTGHGSLASRRTNLSEFDLWANGRYTVTDLAASLAEFPKATPITVIMVQCHAGGFSNLIFDGGDPKAPLADNRVCGFFASIAERMAAGCTSNVDEAYYRDFTTYFVAALTGVDRLGKPVAGADFDKDGKVGMDEAFCWSLLHDDSIDTPVCTSDALVRRFGKLSDDQVVATPYEQVLGWATPAQRAALQGLSAVLRLRGEDRLKTAYDKYAAITGDEEDMDLVRGFRFIRLAKTVVLTHAVRTKGDRNVQERLTQLLKDEHGNPFK